MQGINDLVDKQWNMIKRKDEVRKMNDEIGKLKKVNKKIENELMKEVKIKDINSQNSKW